MAAPAGVIELGELCSSVLKRASRILGRKDRLRLYPLELIEEIVRSLLPLHGHMGYTVAELAEKHFSECNAFSHECFVNPNSGCKECNGHVDAARDVFDDALETGDKEQILIAFRQAHTALCSRTMHKYVRKAGNGTAEERWLHVRAVYDNVVARVQPNQAQ